MKIKITLLVIAILTSISCNALNYYWVGGSGNWSDFGNHWATTSGGIGGTFHNQVPQSSDNVFFDVFSFTATGQTVTVDQTIVQCADMNWTGVTNAPTFAGTYSNILRIYGSLTLAGGMSQSFNGALVFEATSTGKTITSAGKSFNSSITFNGIGGGWTIQDALTTSDNIINLINGSLNTNNQTVSAGSFYSSGANTRALNMGSSVFNLSSIYPAWSVSASGFTFNAGTSTIILNCTFGFASFSGEGLTYHNISFTGIGNLGYTSINGNNIIHNAFFDSDININGNSTYTSVTIGKNANINSSNTFGNLTFSPGYIYTLQAGQTQTINTALNINGNCGALIGVVKSSAIGSQASISKASGAVTVSYVTLKDINATGGATFTANNAIDFGNNTGWIINTSPSKNLYWVGNGGNWDDGNHWSLTSGGSPLGCSPTPVDNAFFDANSFSMPGQTVTENIATSYCKDMNWTGVTNAPTFAGDYSTLLKIYGSLTLSNGMTQNFNGQISFEATTAGKTISSAGKSFVNSIAFNGIGGEWILQDAFTTGTYLILNNGSLNTNGQTVSAYSFSSLTNTTRVLTMGASVFNITSIYPNWSASPTGLTINPGTSSIILNCTFGYATFSGGGLTYNDISFTGNGSLGYTSIYGNNTIHNAFFDVEIDMNGNGTYDNVTLTKNAFIHSSNTFNNLTFSPGYIYTLQAGQTQTINTSLNINGNCGALIGVVKSSAIGSQATISKSSGSVTISYVTLKDINATGGATFTANNAIDFGNNTGWTINASPSKNLYWVGNGGSWSDGNHWSNTSGGSPSGCSPTPVDNAFFDANSFSMPGQTVTITAATNYCKDMNWSGVTNAPAFAGDYYSTLLKIYGSVTFASGMTQSFNGQISFEATTAGKTISSAGKAFGNSVTFNGIGGVWTLQDAFTTEGYLNLNNGTLNTNNQGVNAWAFTSSTATTRTLNMGTSVFNLKSNYPAWSVTPTGLALNTGTSSIILNCTFGYATFYGSGLTYNDISFTGNGSLGYTSINGNNTIHNAFFDVEIEINGNATYDNVTLTKNVNIHSGNTFTNLTFSPGHTYTLNAGQTQTVGNICALGTGALPIRIQSSLVGNPAILSKTNGTICWDYVRISDLSATGGAIFNAGLAPTNSEDMGGNTGFLFTGGCTPLSCNPCTAPGITSQPNNSSSCEGNNAGFSVTANGDGLAYQWQVNPGTGFINISNTATYSGVTTNILNITAVTNTLNGYQYRCIVNGTCAPVATSNAGILTVNPLPTVNLSATAILCTGGSSTITVSATAGTAPYSGIGNFTETAGTHSYTVTDASGCTASTNVTLTEPPVLTASSIATVLLCNGDSSTITISATGGTPPYSGIGNFTATAGTHPYTVTDANGCTANTTVTVTEPTVLAASSIATVLLCNGGSATITISATGGTTPYSSTGSFTATAGTHSYTVTDANGCTTNTTVTITEPLVLTASSSVSSSTIIISASGGTPPYTGTGTFSGLAPGIYSYTVTDANGCSAVTTDTVASYCTNAVTLTNNLLSPVFAVGPNEISWYKFTPSSANSIIYVSAVYDSTNLQNQVSQADLYSGSCNNLVLVQSTSNNALKTLFIEANGLSTQQTYFLKIYNSAMPTNYSVSIESRSPLTACSDRITNGGFENSPTSTPFCSCYTDQNNMLHCTYSFDITLAPPWTEGINPSTQAPSSDYLRNDIDLSNCILINSTSRTGIGYAGIFSSPGPSSNLTGLYKEYIIAPTLPLINGSTYRFEFYYKNDIRGNPICNMGVVMQTSNSGLSYPFNLTPLPKIETPDPINNGWIKVTSYYTASNNSNAYFAIGDYSHIPMTAIDYNYHYIDDVSMVESPEVVINGPSTLCTGDSRILTASNGSNFNWTCSPSLPGFPISGTTATIGSFPPQTTSTTYTVTLTAATLSGCTSVNTFPFVVTTGPGLPQLSGIPNFCQGSSTTLHVNTNFTSTIKWFLNGTPIPGATGANYTNYTASIPGTYTVQISYPSGNCPTFSNPITVIVNPLPSVVVGASTNPICAGGNTQLIALGGGSGATYNWQPAASLDNNTVFAPIATPLSTTTYTVIVTDINGCTATDQVAIGVNSIPTVTVLPASQTICSGSSITPIVLSTDIPGTTFSWTATAQSGVVGATGGTGNSISQILYTGTSGSVIYTITPVANNCPGIPVTAIVYVNPVPIVAASTSQNIVCPGAAVTLSASGASTYIWWLPGNNTLAGASIVVHPIVTTNYLVVGTDINGCNNTANVLITVKDFTVNSPGAICLGYSAALTASGANSYLWSTGATTSMISVFPSTTTTYTVIGTTSGNCSITKTITVTVLQTCCRIDGKPDYAGYTASGGTFTGQFSINGIFTVTGNVTFNSANNVVLGENAKILIKPGATLTIKNSHLHACSKMWDGIYIDGPTVIGGNNPGKLFIISTSLIEDAKNAVYTDNGGKLNINNSTFDHNYVSIVIKGNYYYYLPNDVSIGGSTFKCTGGTLRPPHANDHSLAHIDLTDTKIQVGGGQVNTFNLSVDYGIRCKRSSVSVGSCIFNFQNNTVAYGVYSDTYYYSDLFGSVGVGNSKFFGGRMGVYSKSNLEFKVEKNQFNNQQTAVAVENCGINNGLWNYITIGNNAIKYPSDIGIIAYNNPYAYKQINKNTIDFGSVTNGNGIVVWEITPPSTLFGVANMFFNTITNAHTGISVMNLSTTNVVSNTISVATVPAGQYAYGIFGQNIINNSVFEGNSISGSIITNPLMIGIRASGNSLRVCSNSLSTLGCGLYFEGNMVPQTKVIKNSMNNLGTGLIVSNGAIGPQGAQVFQFLINYRVTRDNKWTGTYSPTKPHLMSLNSNGNLSRFYVKNNPWFYFPLFSTVNPSNTIPYAAIPVTGFQNAMSEWCGNFNSGYGHKSMSIDSLQQSDSTMRYQLAQQIIAGNATYPVFDGQSKWIGRHNLYKDLLNDTLFFNSDTALISFKNNSDNNAMGVIERAGPTAIKAAAGEDVLTSGIELPTTANSLLSVQPANDIESNFVNVYTILLQNHNNGLSFTQSEVSDLTTIANKCPYSDGSAVYIARAILFKVNGVLVNYLNDCERAPQESKSFMITQQDEAAIDITGFKLYPNPNDGNMILDYTLNQSDKGEMAIYDIAGKLIARFDLNTTNNKLLINNIELKDGIYFYQIKVNDKMVKSDKLIIIK